MKSFEGKGGEQITTFNYKREEGVQDGPKCDDIIFECNFL